jgi:uncharacterized membrane protein
MHQISLLIGLILLVTVFGPLFLLWRIFRGVNDLSTRLTSIEERLSRPTRTFDDTKSPLHSTPPPEPVSPMPPPPRPPPPREEPVCQPPPRPKVEPLPELPSRQPVPAMLTEAKIGQRGLLVVGIIILVLGIGYFLQYSFQQGWVSPWLRVVMAYMAGVALLAAGEGFRRFNYGAFGLTLIGGGIATLYFATFAGHGMYQLIGSMPGFVLMVAVTALAATLSVYYNNRWIAVLGLVGGFVTPLLIETAHPSAINLFSYMLILNLGMLAIAFFRRWMLLNYCGWFATWLVYALWFESYYSLEYTWVALTFNVLFFLTYAVAPTLYYVKGRTDNQTASWVLSVPNALVGIAFGFYIIEHRYGMVSAGLLTLFYAALFAGLASWVQSKRPESQGGITLNLLMAMVFVGLTIPAVLSGAWITLFWVLMAMGSAWAASRLANVWVFRGAIILAMVALLKFHVYDYDALFGYRGWYRGMRTPWFDQIAIRTLLIASIPAAGFLLIRWSDLLEEAAYRLVKFVLILTGLHLFWSLTLETRSFFLQYAPGAADAAVSVLWALMSIGMLITGFRQQLSPLRKVAIALFSLTIVKVLFIDMAETATPYRILSSIALGLLLIGGSFLYYHFKESLDEKQ